MQIDISDVYSLVNREQIKKVQLEMKTFVSRQGEYPIQAGEPFELTIANEEGKRLRLSGETDVVAHIPCDRCLEPVEVPLSLTFEKVIPFESEDELSDEAASYIDEDHVLDVDRLIYGELLVNWPAKVLCRDDCKGICMKCGTNLNFAACDCEQGELDPRMAQFQDVFNKFKEV